MKIQHWAIIFLIIMIPFSIVCRNVINNKILLLKDETRYNNIIDNASFDAVAQLKEFDNEFGMGKNIPLTASIMDACIDRFFNTLCVNFNLPANRQTAEAYFCRYIPAIIIIGYDGLYVYSCETTANGFEFKLKPKIPYSYKFSNNIIINFTLDNYVKLFLPSDVFASGYTLETDSTGAEYTGGSVVIGGYVGNFVDYNGNNIDDFAEGRALGITVQDNVPSLFNPYGIKLSDINEIKSFLATMTVKTANNDGNLSYFLYVWGHNVNWASNSPPQMLANLLITDGKSPDYKNSLQYNVDFTKVNVDYQYDDQNVIKTDAAGNVIGQASAFHQLRRETIVNTIVKTLTAEFNEHNAYAKSLGVQYTFTIPNISRDQWNNTIDDISILSFIQGLPMGTDKFYNNYSLGGARIVQAHNIFCEEIKSAPPDFGGGDHKVYHRWYCKLIPKKADGTIFTKEDTGLPANYADLVYPNSTSHRQTTGIIEEKKNESDARKAGYFPCKECCS